MWGSMMQGQFRPTVFRLVTPAVKPLTPCLEVVKVTPLLNHAGKCTVTALDPYGYKTTEVTAQLENGHWVIPLTGRTRRLICNANNPENGPMKGFTYGYSRCPASRDAAHSTELTEGGSYPSAYGPLAWALLGHPFGAASCGRNPASSLRHRATHI